MRRGWREVGERSRALKLVLVIQRPSCARPFKDVVLVRGVVVLAIAIAGRKNEQQKPHFLSRKVPLRNVLELLRARLRQDVSQVMTDTSMNCTHSFRKLSVLIRIA